MVLDTGWGNASLISSKMSRYVIFLSLSDVYFYWIFIQILGSESAFAYKIGG